MSFATRHSSLLVASLVLCAGTASAGEITVMTSGALTAAYLELIPRLEQAIGDRIVTAATSMGIGPDSIPSRVQRGEPVDVVVVAAEALDELIKGGWVVAGSRVDLARSGIGMAVRAGAPRPDISTVDALKRTLLHANSIAYSASVSGVYLSTELFQRLGVADQIRGKSHRVERERVGAVVARGEAEIGFQQISELLAVPGIDYVGPLPPEIQRVTVFSAGVAASAKNPNAARALIRFLASPDAARVITTSGLEPVPPQPVSGADPAGFTLWKSAELKNRDDALSRKVGQDHSARETLADYKHHRFRMLYRDGDGYPEQHDNIVDVVIVQSGEGTLVVGGRMINPKASATAGEYVGTSIEGGERHPLGPGDVVHIPAGIPHSFLVPKGKHVTYVLVKFPAQ